MISKIKEPSAQSIQQYLKGDLVKNEPEKPAAAPTAVTERVDLSATAKDIRQIRQILDRIPEVREDRVQELKRQIDNGTYAVRPDKIAEKLVGESLIDIIA